MDYLCSTLGVKTKHRKWEKEKQLPYYILDRYRIRQVWIDEMRVLFLYPRTELERIPTIKKHILKIQEIEKLPVVLCLEQVSRQRRQYFLDARIPFVVEGKQIYLPFMGIALQEKYEMEQVISEKLQPSAQLLLLYYIYQHKARFYTNDAVNELGFTAMTISRAVKQLEQTGLFVAEKEGVQKILTAKKQGRELFHEIKPRLIDPVRKKIYIDKVQIQPEMLMAGCTALAEKSMLNPSPVISYAAKVVRGGAKHQHIAEGTLQLMDPERQAELQLWKYDPQVLAVNGCVDVLSLALSFAGDGDERIEEAVEEMLEDFWEGYDG